VLHKGLPAEKDCLLPVKGPPCTVSARYYGEILPVQYHSAQSPTCKQYRKAFVQNLLLEISFSFCRNKCLPSGTHSSLYREQILYIPLPAAGHKPYPQCFC